MVITNNTIFNSDVQIRARLLNILAHSGRILILNFLHKNECTTFSELNKMNSPRLYKNVKRKR